MLGGYLTFEVILKVKMAKNGKLQKSVKSLFFWAIRNGCRKLKICT